MAEHDPSCGGQAAGAAEEQRVGGVGGNGRHAAGDGEHAAAEAVARVKRLLAEAQEYAGYYIAARADALKQSGLKLAIYAGAGLVGAVLAAAAGVILLVQLLFGLAGAISALAGTGPWLGELVVSIVLLGGGAIGGWVALSRYTRSSRDRTVRRYEQRKERQRRRFGRDVQQQAAGPRQ